jgi:hypothetical protein
MTWSTFEITCTVPDNLLKHSCQISGVRVGGIQGFDVVALLLRALLSLFEYCMVVIINWWVVKYWYSKLVTW